MIEDIQLYGWGYALSMLPLYLLQAWLGALWFYCIYLYFFTDHK